MRVVELRILQLSHISSSVAHPEHTLRSLAVQVFSSAEKFEEWFSLGDGGKEKEAEVVQQLHKVWPAAASCAAPVVGALGQQTSQQISKQWVEVWSHRPMTCRLTWWASA